MKGNWRGARARDSVLIVTTAGETRLTTSAYDVRRAALVAGGGAAAGGGTLALSSLPQAATETSAITSASFLNNITKTLY
jgi:hypothetical protein